jgi:hypothetical protein
MGKTAVAIELTESERLELEGLASRRRTAQGLAQRARIVLLAADGLGNKDIACGWTPRLTRSASGANALRNIA